MSLPKTYQFLETLGSNRKHMSHGRFAGVTGATGGRSGGERDTPVKSKVDDNLYLRIKPVNMPGLMIHGVGGKSHPIEPAGTHTISIVTQTA